MLELKKLDLKFIGDDGKHIHLLNGQEVPGCTSISGLFPDDGWKFAWPPKLMAEYLEKNVDEFQNEDGFMHDKFLVCLKKAKNAWREKRDKSADTGVVGHERIEFYIKQKILGYMHPLMRVDIKKDLEIENILREFFSWESKYNPQWIASELQVASETHKVAGILDALPVIDGKLILVDFKTSASIKDDYNIQLAGLMICLEEMGCKPDGRAILHLPKTGKYEYRMIDSNLEEDKKDFLAGLAFYNRKNLWKARCKNDK